MLREYQIDVDYSKNLRQMTEEAQFNYLNPQITDEHFPKNGNPIIGLGSVWTRGEKEHVIPVLRGGDNDRNMHLLRVENRWNICDLFATVRLPNVL